jgi:hypothetical protein
MVKGEVDCYMQLQEIFATPYFLLFRSEQESRYVVLDNLVDVGIRSLSDDEQRRLKEKAVFDLAQMRGYISSGSFLWNGEENAKMLGFYMFLRDEELVGHIKYDEVEVKYSRVMCLESKMDTEEVRETHLGEVYARIAELKLSNASAAFESASLSDSYFNLVKLYLDSRCVIHLDFNGFRMKN